MADPIVIVISSISAGIAAASAAISIASIVVSRLTAKQLKAHDAELDRRKFITTLWDRMILVPPITPTNPAKPTKADEEDVKLALGTLELVSVCWVNDLVDKNMIVIVFGDVFVLRTREISRIGILPIIQRTGDDILHKDYPLILRVADEIQQLLTERKTGR